MAKRTETPLHADKTKKLIQASQLINRLNEHANGKVK